MKRLFLLSIIAFKAFAIGSYAAIESGVTLYSEYYPNPNAKFKGTIIFENASGTTLDEWTGYS